MSDRPFVSFAEVKEKVPIPDVLDVFGITDQFRERKEALVGVCPLPQHVHGPRPNDSQFRIDCRKGLWLYKCFGDCADTPLGGGDVINFVKAMTGLSDAHVRFWFADHFGNRLNGKRPKPSRAEPPPAKEEAREVGQEPRRANAKASSRNVATETAPLKPLRFRLNLDPDLPYLRERGLVDETIERFGLGVCSRGLFKGYCCIPVFRHPRQSDDENPVAYLGRWPGEDYDDDHPRYKWPDGFEKSRVVFGLAEAIDSTDVNEPLILVEGCFSVFHLAQSGVPGAVASFGASLSDEQARLLIATGRPITIAFDGNTAGRRGQAVAAELLMRHTFVRMIELPSGTEPEDFSAVEITSLLSG